MIKYFFYLLFFFVALPAYSQSFSIDAQKLVEEANRQELYDQRAWLKLLVYEQHRFNKNTYSSAILTPSFFLAEDGRTNPKAELEETIKALFSPPQDDHNQHPQCRFRGRYVWLTSKLDFPSTLPRIECEEYEAWSLQGSVDSISIIFATGYLGNPASYYGHTLLKLNATDEVAANKLLDVSVNYGAIVPKNENLLSYIVKGLAGGYHGGFSHIQYYFHNHNYGELELRDLWEYELNFSSEEVELVMAHAWEMLGQEYVYYFFRKNCAYRMAEILEVVDDIEIIPNNPAFTIPQSLIKNIAKTELKDKPLVKNTKYYPSRQSRLYKRFASLDKPQKTWVEKLIDQPSLLQLEKFNGLDATTKQGVLDALIDYYQFIRYSDDPSNQTISGEYQSILGKRFSLPPGENELDTSFSSSPDQSRNPSYLAIGYIDSESFGNGLQMNIRPAYYDSLDGDIGHVKFAKLSMGELSLRSYDGETKISSLDIVSIESVSGSVTGLPGDTGNSWFLNFGLKQQNLACHSDCLVSEIAAGRGYTTTIKNRLMIGAQVSSALRDNNNHYGNIYLGASVFTNIELTDRIRLKFSSEYREHVDGDAKGEKVYKFESRYEIAKNFDLRLSVYKNRTTNATLMLGHYW